MFRAVLANGHSKVSWRGLANQPFLNVNGADSRGLAVGIFLIADRVFGFFFQGEGKGLNFHDGCLRLVDMSDQCNRPSLAIWANCTNRHGVWQGPLDTVHACANDFAFTGPLDLYGMDASDGDGDGDGDDVIRLTKNLNDPAGDRRPDLSPDGTKIAFISDRGGSFGPGDGPFNQEIYWTLPT